MTQLTGIPEFTDSVRRLETTDPKHPDTWNPNYQTLINNDAYLKSALTATGEELAEVAGRLGSLEETSSVSVQRAVTLDWLYRDNRIAFELWTPGFTMIDAIDTALVQGIAGDDSVDVASTLQLRANEFYVLSDDAGSILIKCAAILSPNRIRIAADLPRTMGTGVLSRCSMNHVGKVQATARPGDIWLGRPINIGNDMDGGAVVVRRSLNSAEARLYFIDAYTPNWTERMWSSRRQGGDIPAGFADYEYAIPMRGDGSLRMDIGVESVTIKHIIALSTATGLGGFTNPAMRPAAPVMATPAAAAINIAERPTLSVGGYTSPGGSAQAGVQFQVSKTNTFAALQHDSGEIAASLSYQLPAGVLIANTIYYIRARVKDVAGLWSDWAAVTSFTTAATFAYVASPTLVSPASNAIDIGEQPILQTGAFAVVGGASSHAASQWQVRTAAGVWTAPAWDSAEDTVNLLSRTIPAGILAAGQQQYFLRARHKGSTLGWSEWSNEIKITTKQVYANIAGVVLLSSGGDGGTWVYIDADGNTVANPGAAYFNAHPVFGGIQDVTIDGQIMVKVPKFYRKRAIIASGANAGKEGRWISDQPIAGYTIHPAFRSFGGDIDQFWYGKYQASKSGTMLESKPGVSPVLAITLTEAIAAAAARNTRGVAGFMSLSFYQAAAIQWLYLVENATMNSQTKTGQGRVNAANEARVDAADVATATYRGITGLWGNVYQWIDGMKTVNGVVNLWDKDGNKTWRNTGKKRTAADGGIYPATFITGSGAGYDFDDIFIGDTGPTYNTSATAPDFQYLLSDGEYFPVVGGDWNLAAAAGLWCVVCNRVASSAGMSIGARLAKV